MPDIFLAGHPVVMAYVAQFERTATGTHITFPDLPGVTARAEPGEDGFGAARERLHQAIADRIDHRQPIPRPSRSARRHYGDSDQRFERTVPVDQALGMKAILWDNMRSLGVSNVALAKELGCDEKEVRRLLNPAITSRTRLSDALELVGCPIAITIIDTGRPTRILKRPGQSGAYTPSLETVVAAPGPIDLE
jgi:antitoxin HicB